jgi:hypothetical protein
LVVSLSREFISPLHEEVAGFRIPIKWVLVLRT